MADGKRQQLKEVESHVNTRQDRNTYISDGGTWTWDTASGTLSWSATLIIWRGGVAISAVNPNAGIVVGMTAGSTLYVDLDRSAGGLFTVGVGLIDDVANSTDERLVLGVRGADGKFYLRDGTIFSDGDSKTLGTLQSSTDRSEVTSTGVATVSVGFTYLVGQNQLVVYVGGILQIESVHYTESGGTDVIFTAGNIPTAGELITFINVVGGQGPSGSTLVPLQTAYDNGPTVEVTGARSFWWSGIGGSAPGAVLLGTGGAAPPSPAPVAGLTNLGWFVTEPGLPSIPGLAGFQFRDGELGSDAWQLVPLDDGSGDTLLINTGNGDGIRLSKSGEGIEFGNYPGTFPDASAWAGDGPLRWSVYSGTLPATDPVPGPVPAVSHATGLTSILGVAAVVETGAGTGIFMAIENDSSGVLGREFAVTFDGSSGDVQITREADGTGSLDFALDGAAYNLVVFHQGT